LDENLVGKKVKIYSVFGQEVNSLTTNSALETIDTSYLSNGVYFIKIQLDEKILTRKFIKN
jgi:hypothetical protein